MEHTVEEEAFKGGIINIAKTHLKRDYSVEVSLTQIQSTPVILNICNVYC